MANTFLMGRINDNSLINQGHSATRRKVIKAKASFGGADCNKWVKRLRKVWALAQFGRRSLL